MICHCPHRTLLLSVLSFEKLRTIVGGHKCLVKVKKKKDTCKCLALHGLYIQNTVLLKTIAAKGGKTMKNRVSVYRETAFWKQHPSHTNELILFAT